MRKYLYIVMLLVGFSANGGAQVNLVPNGSFEIDNLCPGSFGFIYRAPPWFQPADYTVNTSASSSSDLFDTCDNTSPVGVPANDLGYQYARTRHGCAGIVLNNDTANI